MKRLLVAAAVTLGVTSAYATDFSVAFCKINDEDIAYIILSQENFDASVAVIGKDWTANDSGVFRWTTDGAIVNTVKAHWIIAKLDSDVKSYFVTPDRPNEHADGAPKSVFAKAQYELYVLAEPGACF